MTQSAQYCRPHFKAPNKQAMPWFQPTFKAPTGDLWSDKNHGRRNANANDDADNNPSSRDNNMDSALLSRRILSLLSPLVSSCPSTTLQVRHVPSGPLSFLIGQLPILSCYQSRYPHPSFQVRYKCSKDSNRMLQCTNNQLHALFFHPRKIAASNGNSLQSTHILLDERQTNVESWKCNQGESTVNDAANKIGPCHEADSYNPNSEYDSQGITHALALDRAMLYDNEDNNVHRFGYIYNHPDDDGITGTGRRTKKKKKQKQIVQNPLDGSLGTNSSSLSLQKERGWAQIGQIAPYQDANVNVRVNSSVGDASVGKKRKNAKEKQKKSKMKKKKNSTEDIRRSLLVSHGEDDSSRREDGIEQQMSGSSSRNGGKVEETSESRHWSSSLPSSSSSKTRVFPRDTSHRLVSNRNALSSNTSIPIKTLQTFAEMYEVNNAGASVEALRMFLQLVKQQKYVSWTMVFHDAECSTPFSPSTKKYCTPKGPPCRMWNCICDNQVRAMQASAPLVGAMFVFPMNVHDNDAGNDGPKNDIKQSLDCFLLPLGPTEDPEEGPKDIDSGFERMARWPFLKISCGTALRERWDAFRKIMLDKSVVKVTYQAQVGFMPYHYHCAFDVSSDSREFDSDKLVGEGLEGDETFGYLDLVLPNIWDFRLASWMLTPHEKEENLELEHKRAGFAHMYPYPKHGRPPNASPQLLGLIKAKEDLEFLYILYPTIDGLLERNGLKDAFRDIESPLQSVLSSMECFGIGFKPERLIKIQQDMESQMQKLTFEAKALAKDDEFLISSPQQVSQLLFRKMGLSIPANAVSEVRDNHLSTSEECLLEIQNSIKTREGEGLRIIDIILEFRALNKVLGTYIRPYPKLAREGLNQVRSRKSSRRSKKKSSDDNQIQKIHPMWIQTAVRTGRLSCRKPNMQQVPTGSVIKGVYPRNFFTCSSPNSCLFACDYSQNEVRILAHMSNDEALIRLFSQPGSTDIYKQMAAVISLKDPVDVSDEERAVSKQVTLAIMYGMGLNTVAKKLGVEKVAAKAFFESFYGRFRGVKQWMDSTIAKARREKYVTTITGRRRYVQLHYLCGDQSFNRF